MLDVQSADELLMSGDFHGDHFPRGLADRASGFERMFDRLLVAAKSP